MLMLQTASTPYDLLRLLCAFLCQFIYWLIGNLFELFINICKVSILNSDQVKPIYQKVTMILTLVMTFYITLQVIKYVIEPDTFSDKEKGAGNVGMRLVVVIILIAFMPKVFEYSRLIQSTIIENQILSKVILGEVNTDTSKMGKNFAANVFGMFYELSDDFDDDVLEANNCDKFSCKYIVSSNLTDLRENGELTYLSKGLNSEGKVTDENTGTKMDAYYITFNGLFAVAVGIFVGYMLVLYCVDVGTRVAQMTYLELIAPIAIMGYLAPKKDGMFQKWVKQCTTTYFDLFLRISIIYFVLLVIQIFGESYNSGTLIEGIDKNSTMAMFVYIALILGLLVFARKAPKMLSELFPHSGAASGDFSLSPKSRNLGLVGRGAGAVTGAAAGAIAGGITGAMQGARRVKRLDSSASKWQKFTAGATGGIGGTVRGVLGGAGRGLWNGAKKGNVIKNATEGARRQVESNRFFGNRQENGYTVADQMGDRLRHMTGQRSREEELEERKAPIKRQSDFFEGLSKTFEGITSRGSSKTGEGKGRLAGQKAAAEKRVNDLKNAEVNGIAQSQYSFSRFKTKEEAMKAYNEDVKQKQDEVKREDYVKKELDEKKYREAQEAAAKLVNKSDYELKYNTPEEAERAYQEACQKAKDGVKREDFIIETLNKTAYDEALKQAASSVDMNNYTFGAKFKTKEEADAQLALDLQQALQDLKRISDEADFDYVDDAIDNPGTDGAIEAKLREAYDSYINYNQDADSSRMVTDITFKEIIKNGVRYYRAYDADGKLMHAKEIDDYRKGSATNVRNNNASAITNIDAEIARIKQQKQDAYPNGGGGGGHK